MTSVIMLTPGGLEHGGGIGRMIGYLLESWQADPLAPRAEVADTRGPGRLAIAPVYFARALLRVLRAAFQRPRPLLHVHVAGRGSTLRKAILVPFASSLGLRVVLHLHDFDYGAFLDSLPAWTIPGVRVMFRSARAVVTLGGRDRELVVERLGAPPERVLIVPNAVPRPASAPDRRRPSGGPVRILFLGDPSRRKGVHDLLAAFARPELRERDDWRAVLAGGGGELEGFRAEVARLGLADRVELPGWLGRGQVRDLLAASDMLVLPSYGEGLAMSVLEAMSYGLCVVCTPVGALAEVVLDDVDGRLTPVGDVEALARALTECVADPALRARLGAGAQARFSEGYDVADYPARIAEAYAVALR